MKKAEFKKLAFEHIEDIAELFIFNFEKINDDVYGHYYRFIIDSDGSVYIHEAISATDWLASEDSGDSYCLFTSAGNTAIRDAYTPADMVAEFCFPDKILMFEKIYGEYTLENIEACFGVDAYTEYERFIQGKIAEALKETDVIAFVEEMIL